MKKTYFAILVLLAAAISCKKSTAPAVVDSPKYMSFTAGSTWTYETQNNIAATTTTNIVTSTNRDSTIESRVYHVFTNSNGALNDYYNITLNDYWTFKNLSAAQGINPVSTIYLKDNAAVNISWSQIVNVPVSGFPAPIPVTFTNTIAEKGISRTVNGKAYTDVIRTTTTIAVQGLPPGSITTDIQSYYAAKYGLIESKYKINIPLLTVNADQNTVLKTSDIK